MTLRCGLIAVQQRNVVSLPILSRFISSLLALLLPALLRADVVINEIMYHPASERTTEEYIELYNTGPNPVNVGGWRFTSGVAFTFPNVVIPTGEYLVV